MPLLKLSWLSQVTWSPPYLAYALTSVFQPTEHLCGIPLESLQQAHVLLVLRAPDLVAVPQVGFHKSRGETVTSLTWLMVTLLLMWPRTLFPFWVPRAHCWLMPRFSFTSTLESFSAELLSKNSCLYTVIWNCPDPSTLVLGLAGSL